MLEIGDEVVNKFYKFYKLIEILQQETDEEHILSMQNIQKRILEVTGYEIDRRTVYEYIKTLLELGFDISNYSENKKGYFLQSRDFEEHEIRILMDCITACQFITLKKTNQLFGKLKKLNSDYVTNRLKDQLYVDNRSKSKNEQIYYNINNINEAVIENKKISFNYYHYNIGKEYIAMKAQDGSLKIYNVSPISMILKDDCYYLICTSDKYDTMTHYRIDRMQMVEVLDEARRNLKEIDELKEGFDVAAYAKKCINMYSGKDIKIAVRFKKKLLDLVIDQLGEDVELINDKDGYFIASFIAKSSTGLSRWLLQLGSGAMVIEPLELINEIKEEVNKIKSLYE
ncbi:helix-turn-helix transcriptional regulator [Clostridium sp.]|uniref:helix-turn-helix transcriptional regulator n=1 Tax=Clostridium sp. TaxID=1506 RepID=UPI003D6D9002